MTWWETYQWYSVLCTSAMLVICFLQGLRVQADITQQRGKRLTMLRTLYLIGMTLLVTIFWVIPVFKASWNFGREVKK